MANAELRIEETGTGTICRQILDTLPTWFGIPESVEDYVDAAEANPTVVASLDGIDVGALTLVIHTPYAAEIYVMGVRPEHHRRGIGRAMLEAAQAWLVAGTSSTSKSRRSARAIQTPVMPRRGPSISPRASGHCRSFLSCGDSTSRRSR